MNTMGVPKRKPWPRGHNLSPEEIEKRIFEIDTALDCGAVSYADIRKATGYTITNIHSTFKRDPELHLKYKKGIMSIELQAVSNLVDILFDPKHPDNYKATSTFLGKYKTELDEIFESKEESSFNITTKGGSPVQINFLPQNTKLKEE